MPIREYRQNELTLMNVLDGTGLSAKECDEFLRRRWGHCDLSRAKESELLDAATAIDPEWMDKKRHHHEEVADGVL